MDLPARLAQFAAAPAGDVPVDEALLWVAGCRPDAVTEPLEALGQLDTMAARVDQPTAAAVCRVVYDEFGYRGDRDDYHDPRNSFLDQVLIRRVGMPITLAVVVISVARRRGVVIEPIAAPGHFLLRDPEQQQYRDPFSSGRVVDEAAVESAIARIHPSQRSAHDFLQAVGSDVIVSRVLNNLQHSYAERHPRGLDWVLALRLALPSRFHGDPLALATLCERRGRYLDGAQIFRSLGERLGDDRLLHRATALAARAN